MLPPAPPRLSITTAWPIALPRYSPIARATTSEVVPAVNGTTMLSGRAGQACAIACGTPETLEASKPMTGISARQGFVIQPRLSRIFWPLRREYIEIKHRLIADHLSPVHHVRRNNQQAARSEVLGFLTDVKADLPGENIDDLLVGMAVRPRFVSRHQAVQRQRRGTAGKRLALDAFADRCPRNAFPVNFMQIHGGLLSSTNL